jgi:hypothetical protein
VRFGVEASAGPSLYVLDGVVPFVEVGGRARFGRVLALGGGGGVVLPDSVPYRAGSIDVGLTYAYARACANLLPRGGVELELCAEPMFGALRGSGKDFAENNVEWVFWSAAAALVQAYGPVTDSVLWSLRARLLAPFARHGFSVQQDGNVEEAFRVSGIGGTLAFGLDVEL